LDTIDFRFRFSAESKTSAFGRPLVSSPASGAHKYKVIIQAHSVFESSLPSRHFHHSAPRSTRSSSLVGPNPISALILHPPAQSRLKIKPFFSACSSPHSVCVPYQLVRLLHTALLYPHALILVLLSTCLMGRPSHGVFYYRLIFSQTVFLPSFSFSLTD